MPDAIWPCLSSCMNLTRAEPSSTTMCTHVSQSQRCHREQSASPAARFQGVPPMSQSTQAARAHAPARLLTAAQVVEAAHRIHVAEKTRTQIRQLSLQYPGMTIEDA